jgi:excisionase family DNA binding protein
MSDNVVSAAELAGRLGVCTVTLRRWAREGRLPPPLPGRNLRWARRAVDAWLSRYESLPEAGPSAAEVCRAS